MTTMITRMKSLDLFFRNPYFIFDLPSNATRTETLKRYDRYIKLAKIDSLSELEFEYVIEGNNPERDVATLQTYLQLFKDDKYRQFWISDPTALKLLQSDESLESIQLDNLFNFYDHFIVHYFRILYSLQSSFNEKELISLFKYIDYFSTIEISYEEYSNFENQFGNVELEERNPTIMDLLQSFKEHITVPLLLYVDECSDTLTLARILAKSMQYKMSIISLVSENTSTKIHDLISTVVAEKKAEFLKMFNTTLVTSKLREISSVLVPIEKELREIFKQRILDNSLHIMKLASTYFDCVEVLCWISAMNGDFGIVTGYINLIETNKSLDKANVHDSTLKFLRAAIKGYENYQRGKDSLPFFETQFKDNYHLEYVYVMAANSGDDKYQYILGTNYLEPPTERDTLRMLPYLPDRGIYWLKRSAVTNSNALMKLSMCYMYGYGVYANRDTALFYLKKAARSGNEYAIEFAQKKLISY